MGDLKGFLSKKRQSGGYRPKDERVRDFREVEQCLSEGGIQDQGSRCMDCGVPFCHFSCPVGNVIPDWNDLVFRGQWAKAVEVLHANNNFPEFTGRVCPALCEAACVLGINDDPVTIRQNELAIVEWGFKEGVIRPSFPKSKTGKRVAVVGSGPAGMSCAQQLTRVGHDVVLFEAFDKAGGILRYGIPDFKLEKWVIDRRLDQMRKEGLLIETGVRIGEDLAFEQLLRNFDAVCLTIGSRVSRELQVPGRELKGIHFAMDYLIQGNRAAAGEKILPQDLITARDKRVIVIGGGDTGADCVGTANRQRAKSVVQIELLPKPPECRTKQMPWPEYPKILKTSSSHEEGCERLWSISTKKFSGQDGRVKTWHGVKVDFVSPKEKGAKVSVQEVKGSDFEMEADLVILAMGFVHPEHAGFVKESGIKLTPQGNICVDGEFHSSLSKVFAAGDASRGASLVIWAIDEGRRAARSMDLFLMGQTELP